MARLAQPSRLQLEAEVWMRMNMWFQIPFSTADSNFNCNRVVELMSHPLMQVGAAPRLPCATCISELV